MSKIFVSYSHTSEAAAKLLAEDLNALGHTVWLDHEINGGQAWWDKILSMVRESDLFVFILEPHSLSSTACQREYSYAADLGKPILPVLVSGEVSTNLLPPTLSQIQFVDYRTQDRGAAFRLARAMTHVPPPKPLPDPLPAPPSAPISYLGSLRMQIETASVLGYEQQTALLLDLKRHLRDPGTAQDARTLLDQLLKRRDLLATVAEEINELLATGGRGTLRKEESAQPAVPQDVEATESFPQASVRQSAKSVTTSPHYPSKRERTLCGLVGAVAGTLVGIALMAPHQQRSVGPVDMGFFFLPGLGAAIAGVISGRRPRIILSALSGATIGWPIVGLIGPWREGMAFVAGGVFGASAGAVLGALLGIAWRYLGSPVGEEVARDR